MLLSSIKKVEEEAAKTRQESVQLKKRLAELELAMANLKRVDLPNNVWRLILSFLRKWKVSFIELGGGKTAQFADLLLAKLKSNLSLQPP